MAKKNADNGYGDNGSSGVLETALVLRAFKAADPANVNAPTAIDYLIAQQAADGSWRGDALQTAEALMALAAPTTAVTQRPSATVITDTDKDGVPDAVETLLGMNANLADSRVLADGAGSTVTAPVQTQMLASLTSPTVKLKSSGGKIRALTNAMPDKVINVVISGTSVQSSTANNIKLSRTWEKTADFEVFLVGSSMQLPAIEAAIASLFVPGGMDVLTTDGEANGGMYRAYFGTVVAGSYQGLWGKTLLIHFSVNGGSYNGVASVARAGGVPRMIADKFCIAGDVDHHWLCPSSRMILAVPDAGVSDVEPLLHVGVNVPAGAQGVTAEEATRLDSARVNAMVSGVAVSKSLINAGLRNLNNVTLAQIFGKNELSSWQIIDHTLPQQPIIVCRLVDGAQPASNALILNAGCDETAPAPRSEFSGMSNDGLGSAGLLVVENATVDKLITCLNTANSGGSFEVAGHEARVAPGGFAIGVLSVDHQPGHGDQFDYIALNGMSPTKFNAMTGVYNQFTETWMQWRREAVNEVAPPSGIKLAALQVLRGQLASPDVLRGLPGTVALAGTEGMWVSRGGDSCRALR
ncbi:MAG: hypothetical protein HY272_09835 [Gammaproteobacteria bacterium]|nr:hypothetical protein [Gammaproteobacteria bacterium]